MTKPTLSLPILAACSLLCVPVHAQEALTKDGVIAGTMDIEFGTRAKLDTSGDLVKGSPALGAKDTYKLDIVVAETTQWTGTITRQPNLYSSVLKRRKQDAQLNYSIDLILMSPSNLSMKKTVGKWVGTVPIEADTGAFDLSKGLDKESPLRIAVDTAGAATGFTENFAGKLIGKAEKKEGLAAYTFKRMVGNREVKVEVKKSDPMRFEGLTLAKGPVATYPRTTVNGRLDYDYETGNWYTDGITFKYSFDGKDVTDVVTGSIKWVEDKDRATNGKGYYDFNLRFNESKEKKGGGEAEAFKKMSDEEAFFAVDNSVPALTGRVSYVDTMGGAEGKQVVASKVTYALNANKVTKQQVVNFFKLWLIAVGPTNDE